MRLAGSSTRVRDTEMESIAVIHGYSFGQPRPTETTLPSAWRIKANNAVSVSRSRSQSRHEPSIRHESVSDERPSLHRIANSRWLRLLVSPFLRRKQLLPVAGLDCAGAKIILESRSPDGNEPAGDVSSGTGFRIISSPAVPNFKPRFASTFAAAVSCF